MSFGSSRRYMITGLAAVVALASTVTACGVGGQASTPAATEGAPTAGPTSGATLAMTPASTASVGPVGGFDGTLTLADGRRLRVRCLGSGGPTIVLEGGGIEPDLSDWPEPFLSGLAALSTTCAYSRAGGEGSTAAVHPRTTTAIVSDLYEMLDQLAAMGVANAPYVLVGHSLGGTVALAAAMTRLETTAGLVILDTDFPQKSIPIGIQHCIDIGLAKADCEAQAVGDDEAKGIDAGAAALARPVPDLPIAIASAGRPEPGCVPVADCQHVIDLLDAAQLSDWRQLGPQVTQLIAEGDHDGMLDTARGPIRDVIRGVVEAAR